jgi:hypothetical protein
MKLGKYCTDAFDKINDNVVEGNEKKQFKKI